MSAGCMPISASVRGPPSPASTTNTWRPAMTAMQGPERVASGIGEPAPQIAAWRPSGSDATSWLDIAVSMVRRMSAMPSGRWKSSATPRSTSSASGTTRSPRVVARWVRRRFITVSASTPIATTSIVSERMASGDSPSAMRLTRRPAAMMPRNAVGTIRTASDAMTAPTSAKAPMLRNSPARSARTVLSPAGPDGMIANSADCRPGASSRLTPMRTNSSPIVPDR